MEQCGTFNGDFSELSRLMQLAWGQNKEEPLIYTESFLRSAFEQPGASINRSPALYNDNALIGFITAFPRNVRINGRTWKVHIDSFLTVHPEFRQWGGLGMLLWREMVDRLKQHGADGMISYCVAGDVMDQIILKIARHSRVPTQKIFTVRYLARPVPKGRGPLTQADPEILLRCAERLAPTLDFARVWTAEEARWQCLHRDEAFGCSFQNGSREGVITAYAMSAGRGSAAMRCGLVDDVLWHGLEEADRKIMVQRLLDSASAAAVDLLLVPVLHYADLQPLQSAGFRSTRRTLNAYLSACNPELPLADYATPYIDIF